MRYCTLAVTIGLCIGLVGVGHGDPAPKPKIVPTVWELEFKFQTPKQISLRMPGKKAPTTFWYMLYEVQNGTGADIDFVPTFALYTDHGDLIVSSGRPTVFTAIQGRHNSPLLENLSSAKILQGDDNARDSVAIWRDLPDDARGFDIFVTGLSGEKIIVNLPKPVEDEIYEDGKVKKVTKDKVTLRKTLKLTYALPGEARSRPNRTPKLVRKEWVMR